MSGGFISRNKALFLITISIYFIGIVLGCVSDSLFELEENKVIRISIEGYAKNNLMVLCLLFTGFISFGLLSLFILATNGFLVGIAVAQGFQVKGTLFVMLGILPHGIFEIPSLLIASCVGLMSFKWCINKVTGRTTPRFLTDIALGMVTSILLILIAAVVEAKVTPVLMNFT